MKPGLYNTSTLILVKSISISHCLFVGTVFLCGHDLLAQASQPNNSGEPIPAAQRPISNPPSTDEKRVSILGQIKTRSSAPILIDAKMAKPLLITPTGAVVGGDLDLGRKTTIGEKSNLTPTSPDSKTQNAQESIKPNFDLRADSRPGTVSNGFAESVQLPVGNLLKRKEAVNSFYTEQLKEIIAFDVQHESPEFAKLRCVATIKAFSGDQVARDATRILLLTIFEQNGRGSIVKAGDQMLSYLDKDSVDFEYAKLDIGLFAFQRDEGELARKCFEAFIKEFPKSSWMGEAETGLGLCAAADGEMALALGLFNDVWKNYPQSSQAPKAMFMSGWVYLSQDRLDWAKETYAKLIRAYPGTDYAKRASLILQQHGMVLGKDY